MKKVIRFRGRDGMFRDSFPANSSVEDLKSFISGKVGVKESEVHLKCCSGKPLELSNFSDGELLEYSYEQKIEDKIQKNQSAFHSDKKSTTILEFLQNEEKMKIRIKKQMNSIINNFSMDHNSGHYFEQYCRKNHFRSRMGYIYGSMNKSCLDPETKSKIEIKEEEKKYMEEIDFRDTFDLETGFIFEPLQEPGKKGFSKELKDVYKTRANKIGELFGMKKIGWIFSKDCEELNAYDLIRMARMQNLFGDHIVSVVVRPDKINPGLSNFEAYQVSQQFCDLVKAKLIKKEQTIGGEIEMICPVSIFKKMRKSIEFTWILMKVPLSKCKSMFYMGFGPRNRANENTQNFRELGRVFEKRKGLRFGEVIADFHLLLFLTDYFNLKTDFLHFVEGIKDPNFYKMKDYEMIVKQYIRLQS